MTTQTIGRPTKFTEQESSQRSPSPQTKLTSEPEYKTRVPGRIARTLMAFNQWRHQDLFDIIFNDFFFENSGRGFAAEGRED